MKILSTLIVVFCTIITFSQRPYIYPKFENRLSINILETKNAVIINYDFDQAQLTLGNNRIPATQMIVDGIQDRLEEFGVNAVVLVIQTKDNAVNNRELSDVFNEHGIESIITFDFDLTENYKYMYLGTTDPMSQVNGFTEHHPFCSEQIDYGFLPKVIISKFSKDSLLYEPNGRYAFVSDGYDNILKRFGKGIRKFSKKDSVLTNEITINRIKTGKIINAVPEDIDESIIYLPHHEEIYVVGQPKGALYALGMKFYLGHIKKQVKKDQKVQKVCAKTELNFEFYSFHNGLNENIKTGYQLLYFDTYYKIKDRVDTLRSEFNGNLDDHAYGGFKRIKGKSRLDPSTGKTAEGCDWYEIPKYRYYYLKSVATGDIYLVDYAADDNTQIDIESSKSVKQYLNFITSK